MAGMVLVAHRAGNNLADLRGALDARVDLVEADVHLYRGALEMRHAKAVGRHVLWEPWRDVTRRRDVTVPLLAEVLAAAAGDARLMLDLKGPFLGVAPLTAAALREAAPGAPVAVCSRQWRMLDAFEDQPHIRRIYSAGNQRELARTRVLVRRRRVDGLSIRLSLLTPQLVEELHRHTDLVMVWSVDTEEALAKATSLGVSGVISKNLPMLRRLAERPQDDPATNVRASTT
ncbi:glycerophosphodiester phosphodiesterase [Dactylosporangium sp. NPDC005555]|uniref:glycerophosphodiester phosphodiesterase n=1 Tax=Dactylosporangium sp. NPDC005555 TaxID=3154889 RepID=UPI0033AD0BAB